MKITTILSGWKNFINKSEVIEGLAKQRAEVCTTCPEAKQGKLLAFVKDTLKEVEGAYFNACGCPLSAKVRSNDICPKNKWLMTRYETIKNLGDDFVKLISKGLVPVHLLDWKVYYEAYLKEAESYRQKHGKLRKTHVACTIADDFKISERSIFTVIAFMES